MFSKLLSFLQFIVLGIFFTCGHYYDFPESPYFSRYEGLDYPPNSFDHSYKRARRSTSKTSIILPINAFGKSFKLVLFPDDEVVHSTAKLIVGGREWNGGLSAAADHVVRGYVDGFAHSVVFGSVIDGVFRGTVSLNKNRLLSSLSGSYDTYFIEPSGYYFNNDFPFHSIIYNSLDVKIPLVGQSRVRRTTAEENFKFCGLADPDIVQKMSRTSYVGGRSKRTATVLRSRHSSTGVPLSINRGPHFLEHKSFWAHTYKFARRTNNYSSVSYKTGGPNTRVCNLYLQSDTYLWDHVINLRHIRGNRELAVKEITSIFTQHVQGAQLIYQDAVFRDHLGRLEFRGISFRVDRVLINVTEHDCRIRPWVHTDFRDRNSSHLSPTALPHEMVSDYLTIQRSNSTVYSGFSGAYADENPFCAPNIDITNYLNLHSYNKHDDFCLAYIFTYRDFSGGTLGLAWVAELSGSGGVCEKHRQMREGNQNVHKSLNTGVVTLLNYGSKVASKVSQLTFAHEMGHNFGAKHDDDHKNEPYECLPSVDDVRGNYIMFASATSGDKENNNKFSNCSLDSIAKLLDRVLWDETNCFLSTDGSFCGNQLTEEGEECDCGFTKATCHDKCCHPKDSSSPCKLVSSVVIDHIQHDVECSPTAGVCCTENCQYRPETHICRPAGECYRSSNCSGKVAKCPPVDVLPDGTLCQDNTRVCKQGQCIGSICERIPGWYECSLTRDKKTTPELMCFVACKQNISGAPCISTFQLETDADLRAKYPQLVAELLRDGRGTKLPPGAPCDNYRGYCDVFMRCNLVDAGGPLSRLRNLVFSPQMLQKVKTWITIHWWAVILITVAVIIGTIIFVKICAVSTPPARLHNVDRNKSNLPPILTSSHIPPGPVDQPVFWTVTSHPLRWLGQSDRPAATRYSHSPWGRSRKPKNTKRVIRYPLTEKVCIAPSAPVDPLDFPPSNARQTPLPLLHPNPEIQRFIVNSPMSVVELPSHPIPCSSKSPGEIEPVGVNSGSSNIGFLQQHNFYQRDSRSRRSNSRPNSVLIASAVGESYHVNIRKPKIPSKHKKKIRPVSECTVSSHVPVHRTSPQINRFDEEEVVFHYQPNNDSGFIKASKCKNPRSNSRSISPPSYDDL
ncbi:Disintegrin and metalloproteinase domain-containing protein [Schistosoma japonicum]|uniref:ADAM10 endopeptidase n=1 Tax=Schistosoma japonicum TaxID=6182 RepID=A0A4Z2DGL5_SCHJA|nr:Disintegrin and metalloproteinase domain-containing protein 10 [Schistosoma japonicum]KAH8877482.1 Disintegrin and metalloproteinase domain-containing protein 10 [Schistosoma japonicum]TNN15636.1 Disintegrin and metalloproteinase domain-containing protein [Schistosoma japonicum]